MGDTQLNFDKVCALTTYVGRELQHVGYTRSLLLVSSSSSLCLSLFAQKVIETRKKQELDGLRQVVNCSYRSIKRLNISLLMTTDNVMVVKIQHMYGT